jgi:HEPN domain-containing protein
MRFKQNEYDYISWQNHAFHFYLGSRLLCFNGHIGPATFCAQQAIESMLKATLIYWDKSFEPEAAGHKFAKMLRTLRNKVKGSEEVQISSYFYWDQRYQTRSRYPSKGKGVLMPSTFLDDLDQCFYNLLILVPFQFNSELVNTLSSDSAKHKKKLNTLRRSNKQVRRLRKYLSNWLKKI